MTHGLWLFILLSLHRWCLQLLKELWLKNPKGSLHASNIYLLIYQNKCFHLTVFFSWYHAFLSFALDPDMLERTGDEIATVGDVANHKSAESNFSTNHQISECWRNCSWNKMISKIKTQQMWPSLTVKRGTRIAIWMHPPTNHIWDWCQCWHHLTHFARCGHGGSFSWAIGHPTDIC